jgi:lipid-A-disaccharide synthase
LTVERSIAISAGESSGDLNGAYLASATRSIDQELRFWGAGGPKMREAGVEIAVDMSGGGTIGIATSLASLPRMAVRYLRMRSLLLARRPDLFVPIDFGAFNTRLAQIAHRSGMRVVYYFPPSSWRRKPANAAKLIACGGRVVTPFPWSAQLLGAAGVDARFVGHPLIDIVKPTQSRADFLREIGLDESLRTIGLFPGSRAHEIGEHLPVMIASAQIMHGRLGGEQFVIGAAWGADMMRKRIAEAARSRSEFPVIRVVEGRSYDCMAACDLLITASGTATLEAAILGVPMVIIYRGSPVMRLEYAIRKSVLEDFVGMPNIIADRGVCPEMINEDVTPDKVADIATGLLADGAALARMKAELADVRAQLGEPGAVDRAARAVLEMGELA